MSARRGPTTGRGKTSFAGVPAERLTVLGSRHRENPGERTRRLLRCHPAAASRLGLTEIKGHTLPCALRQPAPGRGVCPCF